MNKKTTKLSTQSENSDVFPQTRTYQKYAKTHVKHPNERFEPTT